MKKIGTIQGNDIIEQDDGSVTFTAGATIDGDGASGQFGSPPCYAPASFDGQTLDILTNAGGPGNWYGVVTDKLGAPIIQGIGDPWIPAGKNSRSTSSTVRASRSQASRK